VKRIAFITLIACAFVFASTSAAFANFGPHGGYASDTDMCASCHRAHTAVSSLGWTDSQGATRAEGSALLISDANNMTTYCYVCHGDGAPGANTNVQSGVYDGDPGATNSSVDTTLNGGGFARIGGFSGPNSKTVMSSHGVDSGTPANYIRWGFKDPTSGASVLTAMAAFTCTSCHDPHGSSNYRILKDVTNTIRTGGYVGTAETPDAWVISNEQGFPSANGFSKGSQGQLEIAAYKPSYTIPQYSQKGGRSMTVWCSACHTAYIQPSSTYSYGALIPPTTTDPGRMYYRHPVDVALEVGTGPVEDRALITKLIDDPGLPLEMPYLQRASTFSYGLLPLAAGSKIWDEHGNISCLTCHRAHGTATTMSGWAATSLGVTGIPQTSNINTTTPLADSAGVNPTFDSALLRYNNRGVCERCHNK
jgi:predicted CXXCH cytochrome family protein